MGGGEGGGQIVLREGAWDRQSAPQNGNKPVHHFHGPVSMGNLPCQLGEGGVGSVGRLVLPLSKEEMPDIQCVRSVCKWRRQTLLPPPDTTTCPHTRPLANNAVGETEKGGCGWVMLEEISGM